MVSIADAKSVRDVIEERNRQIAKGFSAEIDDANVKGQLARAASAYAYFGSLDDEQRAHAADPETSVAQVIKYFAPGRWKPTDKRTDLVKAAALLLAEIDRIDREAAAAEATPEADGQ